MVGRKRVVLMLAVVLLAGLPDGAGCAGSEAAQPGEAPETVVLLHGLGRTSFAMWRLGDRIEEAGFRVVPVGYDSVNESLEDILEQVGRQVSACCDGGRGRVHFVGHSLGGLVIRAYLREHRNGTLGRVVLIGTPNQGTPVVDRFREKWWLKLLGEPALSLGTAPGSFPKTLPPPDYPVGVIAGEDQGADNEAILPGADDGLVPVESTKVAGMADFIVVKTTHWGLRYDKEVAAQTVHFLREGRFRR